MTGQNDVPDTEPILDSWKEIAAYLQRDVSTAIRWEKSEGLPVHRHQHQSRSSVYAYAGELEGGGFFLTLPAASSLGWSANTLTSRGWAYGHGRHFQFIFRAKAVSATDVRFCRLIRDGESLMVR